MPSAHRPKTPIPGRLLAAFCCVAAGTAATAMGLQSILQQDVTATTLMSSATWEWSVALLGGTTTPAPNGQRLAEIDFLPLFAGMATVALVTWFAGAAWIAARRQTAYRYAWCEWGRRGWLWWLLPGAWEILRLFATDTGLELLWATVPMWLALTLSGWLATLCTLSARSTLLPTLTGDTAPPSALKPSPSRLPFVGVRVGVALFVGVFVAMNWQLYHGLLIPHGDSAMYEEHLWNVTHGKGFRSYLDQGLFLGEHIQVIHLLLIPLHLLWPSQMLLELCETLALASGAFPVFWLTRRHTDSPRLALLLSASYLLYFPLQFLDIAIDLKTFRPISFGVPLLLFAFDCYERQRFKTLVVLLLLALSAKEDYCLVVAPLGVWMAVANFRRPRRALFGAGIAGVTVGYLLLVTRILIPWFRDGAEVHYARYFDKFGNSLGEIIVNMLTHPGLLAGELLNAQTILYTLAILLPLGFLPLFSPGRLSVGLPIFVLLCLNQVARDPRHHFHAPLIPVVFWAATAGLGHLPAVTDWWRRLRSRRTSNVRAADASAGIPKYGLQTFYAHFAWTSALSMGLFFSITPLGVAFWDTGSPFYWRSLYIPGERAHMFARVQAEIPETARVASTDFVHTRFTHYERSYDYSGYARKISDYQLRVPDDTDYIVIDTRHRYSEIKRPEQIREFREHPEQWELLPDNTDGYFIVLKRKHKS